MLIEMAFEPTTAPTIRYIDIARTPPFAVGYRRMARASQRIHEAAVSDGATANFNREFSQAQYLDASEPV